MAATTAPINTPELPSAAIDIELPIKSGATLYPGAMANVDANGELTNAGDTAAERCAGNVQSVNTTTGKAIIRRGIHRYANVGSLTNASLGMPCYVKTNQEVCPAGSATNDVQAGTIVWVDATGVWVDHRTAGPYTNP
jgi:hypothetical protein